MVTKAESPCNGALIVPPTPSNEGIRFSLVIPCYNEAENVPELIAKLDSLLRPVLDNEYELIVVDDDSPDGTWQVAEELMASFPCLRVVRRQGERGLSTAVIRGWQAARGDVLGVIDADLQHPPEVILALLTEMARGADLAVASRNIVGGGVSDWSFWRRVLSRGAQLIGLLLLPDVVGRLSDPMSGFFLVHRRTLVGAPLSPLGYKILIEVVGRCQIRWIAETPYIFRERVHGETKVTWGLYGQYLAHLGKLRLAVLAHSPLHRYALVGCVAVAVDMSLLYVLSEPTMLGWGIARSKVLAAQPAMILAYFLHEFWTFRSVAKPTGRAQVLRRFLAFSAISLVSLLGALTVLSVLVEYAHVNRYGANALGILAIATWSYRLHRMITWASVLTSSDAEPSIKGTLDKVQAQALREGLQHSSQFPPARRSEAND